MRDVPKIWEAWRSGLYVGEAKPASRVTVEESFFLTPTQPTVGQWERGPARWFQRKDLTKQIETEIPGVLNVSINRSVEPDAGTCDITIRNVTAPTLGAPELPAGQFSDIGHYTPERGESQDASARWGHAINSWHGVLVPNALLRTYQGFGGHDKPVREAVEDGDIVLNGVWLVDDVSIGADGTIGLKCRDMMKLLIDQQLVPPLVPQELYPLKYERYRFERFQIPAEPPPADGVICPGAGYSSGPGWHSSTDEYYGAYNTTATGHPPSDAFDMGGMATNAAPNWAGNPAWPDRQRSFWLSEPMGGPSDQVWIEFDVPGDLKMINEVFYHTWKGVMEGRGSHTVMVSIWEFGDWVYPETWSQFGYTAQGIPYVTTFVPGTDMVSGRATDRFRLPRDYYATKVRLTVTNLLWADDFPFFSDPDVHGGGFRGGAREVLACFNPKWTMYPGLVFGGASIPYNTENRLGYWQVRSSGAVFAFGDARVYPPWGGMTHVARVNSLTPHPSGQGYWTLDEAGRVVAAGAAQWHQDPLYSVAPFARFTDIAATPSGNGYWVLRTDGTVFTFGDAQHFGNSAHTATKPDGTPILAMSIESHPTQQGYWILWQDGYLDAHNLTNYGGPNLTAPDWVTRIRATSTGQGYWIVSVQGVVFAKGDAQHKGNASPDFGYDDSEWFRPLCWDIYPSSSGNAGYLIERLDGQLDGKGDCKYYGSIGEGHGLLRYDGNYKDYTDIIRDLLLWAGFYLQRDDQPEGELPDVYGNLEDTGIYSTNDPLPPGMFDKRPVLDAIRDIRAVVNYAFFIDAEGGVRWESPNWWQLGNYLIDGTPYNVMPEIDETVQLTGHSVVRSATSARSEIILATQYPYATVNGQKVPDGIVKTTIVGSTAPDLKGIISPAIWHNGLFLKPEEQRTMAELIDMRIWFQRRTANITCVANPLIDVNDQVRIIERQTGDVYIHYVKSIGFSHDLQSGSFTMTLTTHWLGGTPYGQVKAFYACAARPQDDGYWQLSGTGDVYAYGGAVLHERNEGDSHLLVTTGKSASRPIAMRSTPSGDGYWTLDQGGKVISHGDAINYGDLDLQSKSAVDLAITPTGEGYWILLLDGDVHTFGDAVNYGRSTPAPGVQARSIDSRPDDQGYWILHSNGVVEAFNANHEGDADRNGFKPAEITVRLRRTSSGQGYHIVSTGGIVQSFGDAQDHGSGIEYPDGAAGMVWDLLTSDSGGYAIQRTNGNFEMFEFTDLGTAQVSNTTLEWALVTEDVHRGLEDPSLVHPVSATVIDFLKGTGSPSANNAAANGFSSPLSALEGTTAP